MTIPALAVIALVVVVLASSAFDSSSRAEMAADIESPDVLHTLVVCKTHGQRRLALILMWEVLGWPGWGWGLFSWPWLSMGNRRHYCRWRGYRASC